MKRGRVYAAGDAPVLDVALTVLALAFLVFGSRQAATNQVPPRRPLDAAMYVVLVVAGGALLSRRRAPGGLLALEALLGFLYLARDYPYGPLPVIVGLAAYGFARRRDTRVTLAAVAPAAVMLVLGYAIGYDPAGVLGAAAAVAQAGWVLVPALVGGLIRETRVASARADAEAAGRRSEHERLRVAREVHDVVGHGLSVISLQAGVALHVLERRPEQARPALEAIRATSIAALDELRSTLGTGTPEGPVPGLDRLPAILDQVRLSGLTVEVQTVGVARTLSSEVDLAALRVVQESLTNVLRHAGPASARVLLRYETNAIGVTVSDDGSGGSGDGIANGSGRGLAGLRDRAQELGGSLEAGRGPEGGWRVTAVLPVSSGAGQAQVP